MIITSIQLQALMYDLPLLVAAHRRHRKLNLQDAASQAGVAPSTINRVENGFSCDVKTLIHLLRWME